MVSEVVCCVSENISWVEGWFLQLCLLILNKPQSCEPANRQLQEENHPVLESVVYRLCEHLCDSGSASSVCVIINNNVHTNIYFPLLK